MTTLNPFNNAEKYPTDETLLQRKILRKIAERPAEDRINTLKAFQRYNREAAKNSYNTDPAAFIEFIKDSDLLTSSDGLVDLGAGPGQMIEQLALLYRNIEMRGIDLSSGFVANLNRKRLPNASMDVGLIDSPLPDINAGNRMSALSVLTLDRLAFPRVLIVNMARFNRARILATLLPIVSEDDNPSLQGEGKIVYTRPENRIVPGCEANEDREALLELLKKEWNTNVNFTETDYVVSSSGDRQKYTLGVFFTS